MYPVCTYFVVFKRFHNGLENGGKKFPSEPFFFALEQTANIVQLFFLTKIAFFSQILAYCAFVVTDQKENN